MTAPAPVAPPATSQDAATLPARLLATVRARPHQPAIRHKSRGVWREWTWAGYLERIAHTAMGLRTLGVTAGTRVAVHAENRPEWTITDLALQGIGAQSVGVYPTSPASEVEHVLAHSGSEVVVVEDQEQLDKTLAVRHRLPRLRHIVVIDPRGVPAHQRVELLTFAEVEQRGAGGPDPVGAYTAAAARVDPATVATVVYTSGTTGPPKGAMLSHRNLVATGQAYVARLRLGPTDEMLSYLPLCHVAERLFAVVGAVCTGMVVNFGEGGPSFRQDLRDVQPTLFLGVPRVWEKLLAEVEIRMADASRLKRALHRACLRHGRRVADRRMVRATSAADRLAGAVSELLVFRALRERLGLVRVRAAVSGAAPIAPQVLRHLWAVGVPVVEVYGQTENAGLCTLVPPHAVRIGTVGTPLPGVELRIADDGEILTRSPGVFVGYLDNPEATAATVDPDGWLRTGDVGEIDADGYLRITDRKKDIIITAGGKNVSPSEIENRLKTSPYIRDAVVIGDGRRYVTALIGIERDTVGDWATRRGIAYTTLLDLSARPEVRELIQDAVDAANQHAAQVARIKRFTLLGRELDHEDGELTATQKVKRSVIEARFATEIELMYR